MMERSSTLGFCPLHKQLVKHKRSCLNNALFSALRDRVYMTKLVLLETLPSEGFLRVGGGCVFCILQKVVSHLTYPLQCLQRCLYTKAILAVNFALLFLQLSFQGPEYDGHKTVTLGQLRRRMKFNKFAQFGDKLLKQSHG